MAFRLTKAELTDRNELVKSLQRTQEAFATTPDAEHLEEFLVALRETDKFRDSVASRLRDEFEEKSERWMESEKGDFANEFIDQTVDRLSLAADAQTAEIESIDLAKKLVLEWENADFSDVDTEALELEDYAEYLQNLLTEVE